MQSARDLRIVKSILHPQHLGQFIGKKICINISMVATHNQKCVISAQSRGVGKNALWFRVQAILGGHNLINPNVAA